MTATAATERMWAERVRAWRASGESAEDFAEGKGFAGSTLRVWSSRLGQMAGSPRLVQLVPRAPVPAPSAASGSLEIEIGEARLRVSRGFDRELLAEVVSVLRRGAR